MPNEQGDARLCHTLGQHCTDRIAKLNSDQQVRRSGVPVVKPHVRPEERYRAITRHDIYLQRRGPFSEHFP
ncbi:hypothetical protein WK51_31310 [Burkholderia ubonensis]|nr:hypothetical protein WK51_31310 [Burkholderia ubonensis]